MQFISTVQAPAPAGHYSQATMVNGFVFVAGQLPVIPNQAGPKLPEGIEAQTRQALENATAIVEAAGGSRDSVVSATMYITSVDYWSAVNGEFAAFFGSHRPSRAMVTSPTLHFGSLVEVQIVAYVG